MPVKQRLTSGRQWRQCFFHRCYGSRFGRQEPAFQLGAATVPQWRYRLIDAFAAARRTAQPDMHMGTVPEPGPDFAQPVAIAARIQALLFFDGRVNKNTGDLVILRRQFNQRLGFGEPQTRHHPAAVGRHQIQRLRFKQLISAPALARRLQLDIRVQPRLMAGVAAAKTTAVRHRHIPYQHLTQPQMFHLIAQAWINNSRSGWPK